MNPTVGLKCFADAINDFVEWLDGQSPVRKDEFTSAVSFGLSIYKQMRMHGMNVLADYGRIKGRRYWTLRYWNSAGNLLMSVNFIDSAKTVVHSLENGCPEKLRKESPFEYLFRMYSSSKET